MCCGSHFSMSKVHILTSLFISFDKRLKAFAIDPVARYWKRINSNPYFSDSKARYVYFFEPYKQWEASVKPSTVADTQQVRAVTVHSRRCCCAVLPELQWSSQRVSLRMWESQQPKSSPVQFSRSVVSDALRPHGLHTPGLPVHHQLPELTQTHVHWVSDAIQASHPVFPFSSGPQSFPASGSFLMSQFFASGGQTIGVSASTSVIPMNIQDWFPLGGTGWISLQNWRAFGCKTCPVLWEGRERLWKAAMEWEPLLSSFQGPSPLLSATDLYPQEPPLPPLAYPLCQGPALCHSPDRKMCQSWKCNVAPSFFR